MLQLISAEDSSESLAHHAGDLVDRLEQVQLHHVTLPHLSFQGENERALGSHIDIFTDEGSVVGSLFESFGEGQRVHCQRNWSIC